MLVNHAGFRTFQIVITFGCNHASHVLAKMRLVNGNNYYKKKNKKKNSWSLVIFTVSQDQKAKKYPILIKGITVDIDPT